MIAYARLGQQDWPGVEQAAMEGLLLYQRLANQAMQADSLCQLAAAQITQGKISQGLSAGREAYAISTTIDNAWGQIHSSIQLIPGLLGSGDLGEAYELATRAISTAREQGIKQMEPMCVARLGSIYCSMLALDEARRQLLEAQALDQALSPQPFRAAIAGELCACAALSGAWDEALAYALEALAGAHSSLLYTRLHVWSELEALARAGRDELVGEILNWLEREAIANPRYRLTLLRCQAVLAERSGGMAAALGLLETALAQAERLELPGEQWPISQQIARLLSALGHPERARAAWAEAGALIRRSAGSIIDAGLARALLMAASASLPGS